MWVYILLGQTDTFFETQSFKDKKCNMRYGSHFKFTACPYHYCDCIKQIYQQKKTILEIMSNTGKGKDQGSDLTKWIKFPPHHIPNYWVCQSKVIMKYRVLVLAN